MIYVGVDPGVLGGIAMLNADGGVLRVTKMPPTDRDLLAFLEDDWRRDAPIRAVLERAAASPQMGVISAFTFGKGYGALRMALAAVRIPYEEVAPAKWQTVLGCRSGGDKNVTKRRAQQLFPSITVTHMTADALLLAEFCRRLEVRRPARTTQTKGRDPHGEEGREGDLEFETESA